MTRRRSAVSRAFTPTTSKSADTWRGHAACRNEDPELFFPVGTTGPAPLQTDEAKAVCHRCPVTEQCLTWALENRVPDGVWGGLSEDERRGLLRHIQRTKKTKEKRPYKPVKLAECGTRSAYQRHVRRGEPIDEACRAANRVADRRLRNTGTTKAAG